MKTARKDYKNATSRQPTPRQAETARLTHWCTGDVAHSWTHAAVSDIEDKITSSDGKQKQHDELCLL